MSEDYHGAARQLVPGTLRGYRAWYVPPVFSLGRDGPLTFLESVSMNYSWPTDPSVRAICFGKGLINHLSYKSHPTPVKDCLCGYYATYQLDTLPFYNEPCIMTGQYVFGSVAAHGKIVLGTKGFRAKYMRIESLVMDHSFLGWLAEAYQATLVTGFDELLAKFPPSNVDELIRC